MSACAWLIGLSLKIVCLRLPTQMFKEWVGRSGFFFLQWVVGKLKFFRCEVQYLSCKTVWAYQTRATENRFFAGSDRFLVCKTDSICIKRIFFGPKKNTLCGSYTGPISWISRVKPLIVHNYSNYQLVYSSLSIYLFFACTEACQIEFLTQLTSVDTV